MQIDSYHLGGLGILVDSLGFNSTPNSDLMTLQSRTLYLKEVEYFTGFYGRFYSSEKAWTLLLENMGGAQK